MRRRFFPGILVLVLATAPAVAGPVNRLSQEETRKVSQFIGECTVRREHDLARQFVLSGGDWKPLERAGRRLIQTECLPKSNMVSIMTNDAMLGNLAEALIKADGIALPADGFVGVPQLSYVAVTPVRTIDKEGKALPPERIASQEKGIARRELINTRLKFGECIVRREPTLSRYVLSTSISTDAELAAIKALAPAMGDCLAKGQTVGFDRETLRGSFAVALYRLTAATTSNGASQ